MPHVVYQTCDRYVHYIGKILKTLKNIDSLLKLKRQIFLINQGLYNIFLDTFGQNTPRYEFEHALAVEGISDIVTAFAS